MAPPDPTPPEIENLKQPRPINPAHKPSFPLNLNSPQPQGSVLPAVPISQAVPSIASLHDPPSNGLIPRMQLALLEPPVSIGPPAHTRSMGDLSNRFAARVPPPPALYKDPRNALAPLYQHTIPSQRQHSQLRENAIRAQERIAQTQAAIQAISQTTAVRTAAIHAAAVQSGAFQAQAPRDTSGYIALGLQGQGSQFPGPQYAPNTFGFLHGPNIQPQLVPLPNYYGPPPNPAGHPEGEVTVKYQLVKGDPTLGPNGLKYGQVPFLYPHITKRKRSAQSRPSSLTTRAPAQPLASSPAEPSLTTQDQDVPGTPTQPLASSPAEHSLTTQDQASSPAQPPPAQPSPQDPEKDKIIDNQQG